MNVNCKRALYVFVCSISVWFGVQMQWQIYKTVNCSLLFCICIMLGLAQLLSACPCIEQYKVNTFMKWIVVASHSVMNERGINRVKIEITCTENSWTWNTKHRDIVPCVCVCVCMPNICFIHNWWPGFLYTLMAYFKCCNLFSVWT